MTKEAAQHSKKLTEPFQYSHKQPRNMVQEVQYARPQGVNNKLDEGARDEPEMDPKLVILQDTRPKSGFKPRKLKAQRKSDSEDSDSDFQPKEVEEVPEELERPDEPPRKRSRPQASEPEARPRSKKLGSKQPQFTTQQKDIIRDWMCKNFGARGVLLEMFEPAAQAAGLTAKQVRDWINDFYRHNPTPTLEQAMAWRKSGNLERDNLKQWFMAHRDDPYPSQEEKQRLASESGKTLSELNQWLRNARRESGLTGHKLSKEQVATLRASYKKNANPSAYQKERLVSETGLTLELVEMWFYTRRKNAAALARTAGSPRLPAEQTAPLYKWLHANMGNPYPGSEKMKELAEETGLNSQQVTNWFQGKRTKIKNNKGKPAYEGLCPCCKQGIVRRATSN